MASARFSRTLVLSTVAAALSACSTGTLPQTVSDTGVAPNVHVVASGRHATPAGLTPADLQSAYALPSSTKGSGQIVAIVNAYDNPNVASDLAQYRSTFELPTANFTKYNQRGETGDYPQGNSGWGLVADVAVDMLSASCPNCTIDLIEANSNSSTDLGKAVVEAVKLGAHVVSIGYGYNCSAKQCPGESYFNAKGVTYLAPSGDAGLKEGSYPADFDTVVAVAGTMLSKGGSGKRGWTESVWDGADGGCIAGDKKPAWQHDSGCKFRLANDVASVAWNLAAYDTYGEGGWITINGTVASPPFLAGVFGLAGNAGKQDGGRTFWEKTHQKHLYVITQGASSCSYSNGRYNTCTGWGTPHGIGAF